jgi:hypothetical protein
VIDRRAEQASQRRRWNVAPGSIAVGAAGATARPVSTKSFRERILWVALLPVYVVMAVFVTIGYAVAVLVVDARSLLRRGRNHD